MLPEVSVIIPTYNRSAMVTEAIESVIAQRGVSLELIVIDDGSTDDTPATVAAIEKRLTTCPGAGTLRFERGIHRGPAAARNRGASLARGRWMAFLDSDDLWMPTKLDRQTAFMRTHPECRIAQTEEIWLWRGRRRNPGRRHLKRPGDIFVDSLRTCLVSPSAVIMETEMFRALGGFDEMMAAAEDYDLWLRILIRETVGLITEPLVIRRAGHPDQLSATTPAIDRFRILALAKLLEDPRLSADQRSATAEVLAEKSRIYARGLRRRGHAARSHLFDSIANDALNACNLRPGRTLAEATAAIRAELARPMTPAAAIGSSGAM